MTLLNVQALGVKRNGASVLAGINFRLREGDVIAVAGRSGSGKTTLLEALSGRLFFSGTIEKAPAVKTAFVPQQHRFYNTSHTDTFYYQQRFNSLDADDAATVADAMPHLFATDDHLHQSVELFRLKELKERRLIHLSNGEHKRLQLANALASSPEILLLDNPFVGLDITSRAILEDSLSLLAQTGIGIIFTTSTSTMPTCTTGVLLLQEAAPVILMSPADYLNSRQVQKVFKPDADLMQKLLPPTSMPSFQYAVRMQHVNVQYGHKKVLEDICWEVRSGERWSLSGPNGAGKSTLLSLITADNPHAYANEIFLFDKRRGSGESIWDIKRQIGFVSPELHLHFDPAATVFDTIASGFFDTIGLFRAVSALQQEKVNGWLQLLQLHHIGDRLLRQLPLGTQRLLLLARALVKNPPLLVLDEPLQGIDELQAAIMRNLVDDICLQSGKTLIYVSHYPEDMPGSVNQYIRLEGGRTV